MARELIKTPTCEVTGLPLLIYPSEPPSGARFNFVNFHHPLHPNTAPELAGDAGRAARFSIGQDVAEPLHRNYHYVYGGPDLTIDKDKILRGILLPAVGVAPRQALDVRDRTEPKIVELSDDEFAWITDPKRYHFENANKQRRSNRCRRTIGRFIASYAIDQDIRTTISDSVIDEFLSPDIDVIRKKELGNFIMTEALHMSIGHLSPEVASYQKTGFGLPQRRGLFEVVKKFVAKSCLPDYYDEIAKRIRFATT